MNVILKYKGYLPVARKHVYSILCANGHADEIYEDLLVVSKEVDMPDELWSDGSGWADIECDACGYRDRERVYPGFLWRCPVCDAVIEIPEGAVLEASNLEDLIETNIGAD
jgi:predicted Zn-ribbon and HTH transcriptional regulator